MEELAELVAEIVDQMTEKQGEWWRRATEILLYDIMKRSIDR